MQKEWMNWRKTWAVLGGVLGLSGLNVFALPDLTGLDGRQEGMQHAYFEVQDGALHWGDPFHIHLAVCNESNDNAPPFTVRVWLSPDANIDSSNGFLLYEMACGTGMNAWTHQYADGHLYLPPVNPFGNTQSNFWIGMIVDADNQVAESNEGNNCNRGIGSDKDAATILKPVPCLSVTDSVIPADDRLVAFADVAADGRGNAKNTQTITLTNPGHAALTISNLVLRGDADFALTQIASSIQSLIATSSLPRVMSADGSEAWVLTVAFDPTTSGLRTGTLTVTSNDPQTPNLDIALTGRGTPTPHLALTVADMDFGTVINDGVGGCQLSRVISLENTGASALTIGQNGLSLSNGVNYRLISVTSSTRGKINLANGPSAIAPGSTEVWNVSVQFDPVFTGWQTDRLRILSDDPNAGAFAVSLRGHGVGPMRLAVKDSDGLTTDRSIVFPNTHVDGHGKELASATVTLRNTGEAPLTVASNGFSFAAGASYRLHNIVSDRQGTIDLAAGAKSIAGGTSETWTATVIFDPLAVGAHSDTLTMRSDDLTSPDCAIALSGQGIARPALRVDNLALNFGAALNDGPGGRVATRTVLVKNAGALPLIIARNGLAVSGDPDFALLSVVSSTRGPVAIGGMSESDRSIAPAQAETWTLTVAFDASATEARTGILEILSNDPATSRVVVSLSVADHFLIVRHSQIKPV